MTDSPSWARRPLLRAIVVLREVLRTPTNRFTLLAVVLGIGVSWAVDIQRTRAITGAVVDYEHTAKQVEICEDLDPWTCEAVAEENLAAARERLASANALLAEAEAIAEAEVEETPEPTPDPEVDFQLLAASIADAMAYETAVGCLAALCGALGADSEPPPACEDIPSSSATVTLEGCGGAPRPSSAPTDGVADAGKSLGEGLAEAAKSLGTEQKELGYSSGGAIVLEPKVKPRADDPRVKAPDDPLALWRDSMLSRISSQAATVAAGPPRPVERRTVEVEVEATPAPVEDPVEAPDPADLVDAAQEQVAALEKAIEEIRAGQDAAFPDMMDAFARWFVRIGTPAHGMRQLDAVEKKREAKAKPSAGARSEEATARERGKSAALNWGFERARRRLALEQLRAEGASGHDHSTHDHRKLAGRVSWVQRRYREVINEIRTLEEAHDSDRMRSCLLLADSHRALGESLAAREKFDILAGYAATPSKPPAAPPDYRGPPLQVVCDRATGELALVASGESLPGRELGVRVKVGRHHSLVEVQVVRPHAELVELARALAPKEARPEPVRLSEVLTAGAFKPSLKPKGFATLPGGVFGAARVNGRFLFDEVPASQRVERFERFADSAVEPAASVAEPIAEEPEGGAEEVPDRPEVVDRGALFKYTATFRFDNDRDDLWRGATRADGTMVLEVVLPTWADRARTSVVVEGEAVELGRLHPVPSARTASTVGWEWLPPGAAASTGTAPANRLRVALNMGRQSRLLGAVAHRSPLWPPAIQAIAALLVVLIFTAIVLRRRSFGTWTKDPEDPWSRGADLLQAGFVVALLAPTWGVTLVRLIREKSALVVLASPALRGTMKLEYLFVACAAIVAVLVTRRTQRTSVDFLRHVGAVLFCGYLAIRLDRATWVEWVVVAFAVAPALYYFKIMPRAEAWGLLNALSPEVLRKHRDRLLTLAIDRLQLASARRALAEWPPQIAAGSKTEEQFLKAKEAIRTWTERSEEGLDDVESDLAEGIGDDPTQTISVLGLRNRDAETRDRISDAVLLLGPFSSPLKNAALAVAGTAPPLALLALYTKQVEPVAFIFYTAFLGAMFRFLAGNNGLQKGILLGGSLAILTRLPSIAQAGTPAEFWGYVVEGMMLLAVLTAAGVILDLVSAGRHWRRLLRLYDSPTVTGLGGVVAAAMGTAITTWLAGESAGVVKFLFAEAGASFGL